MSGNGNGKASFPHLEAPQGEREVTLRDLEVEAVISGLYAETTCTMRFHNPNARVLEGSLVFPLPDGAVVCGYALDVAGRMVEGVVVPKQEARRILEAEIRKGVDPGLVEQVQGNVYRTRVYPLPAGGTRTVRVTYVSELTVDGRGAAYHLPLAAPASVDEVRLRVEVAQSPVTPVLAGGPGNLRLEPWEGRWVARATLKGAAEDLQVRLPDLPDRFVLLERTAEGEVLACASARVPEPEGQAWTPARVAVAWDASGSRSEVSRELALLRELAKRWPGPADLVVVRERVEAPVAFANLRALAAHLEGLAADGGTALAQLDLSAAPHPDAEAWLLFSDGLETMGGSLPRTGGLPVFCLTSQSHGDPAWLEHLAERTGGRFFNLLRLAAERVAQALAAPRQVGKGPATSGCTDVHRVSGLGRVQVLARLIGQDLPASVTFPGEAPVPLEAAQAVPGRLLARAWAGRQAAALAVRGEDPRALAALGRRYGLVTPGTSLLVLETLEQYLEYDLEPPNSQPELRKALLQLREARQAQAGQARRAHLDQVARLWAERVRWWETDFRPAKAKKELASPGPGAGPMARMAPAPAPAPPVEMRREVVCRDALPSASFASAAGALEEVQCEAAAPCGAPPEPCADEDAFAEQAPTISIQPWVADTPYLEAMRKAGTEAYSAYLREKATYSTSPSFFLDCGDHLVREGHRDLGLRVLSNLVELGLDEPALLRMYAWRLGRAGELDSAIAVLERVLLLREDEPQSHRDLGLLLAERWERDGDAADAARAVTLLYEVVQRPWDRFPEIELIALMELNRLLARVEAAGVQVPPIDPRLKRLLDLDVRISMSWDADLTDVDLHVFEPTGEHAYYGHRDTEIGGLVSRDFTQGYGPEEYVLRRAVPGVYAVKARYYGSHQQTLTGPCTVLVHVFTDYGRPEEARQDLLLRLEAPGDEIPVGEVAIQPRARASR